MAETYTGHVQNGVIVLDDGTPPLPEGTQVCVELKEISPDLLALRKLLLSVAGTAEGLPADFAEQHDHYLHGQAKR